MADKKISGLDAVDTDEVTNDALFEIEDDSLSPSSRKLTLAQVKELVAIASTPTKRVPFVYDTAGAGTHACTPGVSRVDAEAWGAGGAPGSDEAGYSSAGAGGGYALKMNEAVDDGEVLEFIVGAGGAPNDPGTDGGTTTINHAGGMVTIAEATGGQGGHSGGQSDGGVGTTGDVLLEGGSAMGNLASGSLIDGGDGAQGGQGGKGYAADNTDGKQPGGGGPTRGDSIGNWPNGADGLVIIWEHQPI